MRCINFIPVWESNKTLYKNGELLEPTEGSNLCNLSDWYLMTEKDLTLAGHYCQRVMQVDPLDYKPHINIASVFRSMGQYELANKHVKIAKELAAGACSEHIMGVIDRLLGWTAQEVAIGKPATVKVDVPKEK